MADTPSALGGAPVPALGPAEVLVARMLPRLVLGL